MSAKASAAAPYVQRLLNDQDVQERIGQALRSGRDAYGRARRRSTAEAITDKKLQRRIFESLGAAREAWVAVEQPPPSRTRRLLPALIAVSIAGIGAAVVLSQRGGTGAVIPPDSYANNAGASHENDAAPAGGQGAPIAEPAWKG